MAGSVENGADEPAKPKDVRAKDARAGGAGAVSAPAVAKEAAPPGGAAVPPAGALAKLPPMRIDPRMAAVAVVALVVGTGFGLLAAPRGGSGETLVRVEAGLEAGRAEAARLDGEIAQVTRTLAAMREATEAARGEGRTLAAGLMERLTRMEQGLDRRFAALAEKPVAAERDAGTPPAAATPAQPEKRAATPSAAAAPTTPVAAAARPEPTQTASIAEAKPKAETVEGWALREVYDGVAMLEDRKRRLVEVAPGDAVPGIGRVEAIERRGRSWVVVTRQGLITPQTW